MSVFERTYYSMEECFGLGIDKRTGKPFLEFPVENRLVGYAEYYAIDQRIYDGFPETIGEIKEILALSRARLNDDNILQQPGRDRGWPRLP